MFIKRTKKRVGDRTYVNHVLTEQPREAGPVHVGHELWQQLGIDAVLAGAGLSARTRVLTEIMTLNRLVCPLSEHAMPAWVRRTALADLLGENFDTLVDESLYQILDRLHPQHVAIERALAERERTLCNEELSTHQVLTVVLPAGNGDVLKIRKGTAPEPRHKEIYKTLHIPAEVMKPVRTWVRAIVTEPDPQLLEIAPSQRSTRREKEMAAPAPVRIASRSA